MYRWSDLKAHKNDEHPGCMFCKEKRFYDYDALYKHYRIKHYQCDLCKKMGRKKQNKKTG